MLKKGFSIFLAVCILSLSYVTAFLGTYQVHAAEAITPFDENYINLYDHPDGAINGSTYIFNPDANFHERMAFDFKRMKDVYHVNTVGIYNIVQMTDGDRDALFTELEKNGQKAVIRIESYDGSTFKFDNNDLTHSDAINVINHYNTNDTLHGYTALLNYLITHNRLNNIAYFAVNMPVDDGTVADHFKNQTYADGRANPEWSTSQVAYADDIINRLRSILGNSAVAKLYLSVFYGWDFAYNTPSYANIAHKADGYFFNNYSYPLANPADENATSSVRINQPRLQQGMDRFMAQYPDDLKILEYGFHTVEFNNYKPTSQTAGLVENLAAKKLALKETAAFYKNGTTGGKSFNVRGSLYFAQNLYKEEGNPATLSDWTLDYPNTHVIEAEDTENTLYLNNGSVVNNVYSADGTASGGGMVQLDTVGKAVEFFNLSAGSVLKVRYSSTSDASLSLYVNGSFQQKINFTASVSWADKYVNVNIPLQGSVKLLRDAGDGDVKIDNIYIYNKYEAEVNTTETNCISYVDAAASNGSGVTIPAAQDSYLEYGAGGVKAGSQLLIKYAANSDEQLGLYINGKLAQTLEFEASGALTGNNAYFTKLVPISIPANAIIKLKRDSTGTGVMNIDYIQVNGQYEAEFASGLYNGVHGFTDSAASGSAVAADFDVAGASAVFSGVLRGNQLKIRYSSTQNTSMTVYVNGNAHTVNFPSTGSASTYNDAFVNTAIPDNANVVIQRNGDNDAIGLRIDYIRSTLWYEAESAAGSSVSTNNDVVAFNGKQAAIASQGDSVEFNNVSEGSQLQIRYANSIDAQLSLYINGRYITKISFPSTGASTGSYKTTSTNVDIPHGAVIKLKFDSGDSAVFLDSISIIEKNEAETANLIGGAATYADTKASGGMGADISHVGEGVEFTNVKAGNKLLISYTSDGDGKLGLYVNGVKKKDVTFPSLGTWKGQYNISYIDTDIPSGATVKFLYETGGSRVRIDNLAVSGIQEAENYSAKSDGVILYEDPAASNGVGMTGLDTNGNSITFVNKNGASSISVRYKSDNASQLSLYVKYRDNVDNAAIFKTDDLGVIKFPATGGSYRNASVNAYIRDGMQVILKKDTDDTVDSSFKLDSLAFSDKYEAEAAILGGGAVANYEGEGSTASNKYQVIATGGEGAFLTFENVKAANRLTIGYTCENVGTTSKFSLYLAKPGENFVKMQDITFKPTGSWSGPFAERVVDINIPYGSKIKLQNDSGDTPVHFDYIRLSGVYEAENGNFFGNSRTWYNAVKDANGPSGYYWAWAFADVGDGVEIPGVRGGNQVYVRYSEGEDPSKNGQLGLIVNGSYIKDVVMPYTGSWGKYEVVKTDQNVPEGSVVKLQNTKPTDHTAPIDYIEISDKQREAENANMYGNASVTTAPSASYGYAAEGLGAIGDSIEFPGMNAGNQLKVRYTSAVDGTLGLYVNGLKKQSLNFPTTMGQFSDLTTNIEIPQGAIIKLQFDNGDTMAAASAIDYIETMGTYATDNKYEAENGALSGGISTVSGSVYSGGWKVSSLTSTSAVEFPSVHTGNALLVRYASANGGQLSLYVNGVKNQDIVFPATQGFDTKEVKVHIPKGASVKFQNDGASDAGVDLDYMKVSDKYEAEYSIMHGVSNDGHSPIVVDDAGASNGKGAAQLWAPDNGTGSFEFLSASAGTQLTLAYASGDSSSRKLTLYINNQKNRSIIFPSYPNGSWGGNYNRVTVPVDIPEGAAIKIQKDQGDSEVNLDYIMVSGIYEAEDANLFGSAYTSSDYTGNIANASRGLAVNGMNTAASGVEFSHVNAGNKMDIRYASQDEGTLYMYVNGGSKKKVTFPSTGGFTGNYSTVSIPAAINNGDTVKWVFEAKPGENPVSLDNIKVYTGVVDSVNGMEIESTVAGLTLLVNYSSQVDNGQMSLYVNNVHIQNVTFPNTHGVSAAKEIKIRIPSGVKVKLQDDGSPDAAVNLVDMKVSDKYEAEYSTLFGQDADGHQTSAFGDGPASNGQAVHFIWGEGSYLEFPGVIAGKNLIVGYSSGAAGQHLSLYVNGTKAKAITFANTGGWTGHYQEVTVPIDIPEGATVKIQKDPGDADVIIDYIKVSNVTVPDTVKPSAPGNLHDSSKTYSTVTLSWNAAADNVGVVGYDVYNGESKANASNITVTSYVVTGLTASTLYTFKVKAKDAAGNESDASNVVTVTTDAESVTPTPTATLTGATSVISGQQFFVDYGLSNVSQSVYAQDQTFNYDSTKIEFLSVESLKTGLNVVDKSEIEGQVRIITASTGAGNAVTGTNNLLKLRFKAKAVSQTVTSSVYLTNEVVANANGIESTVNNGTAYNIQIIFVDKAALQALITSTQALHNAAVEGAGIGKYPTGTKATLQAAIDKAKAAADNGAATQLQVNQASDQLNEVLQSFTASVNVPSAGDLNADGNVSIGDLAIVAAHYGNTSADPNWNTYKQADINNDGKIDIVDLAAVARLILG